MFVFLLSLVIGLSESRSFNLGLWHEGVVGAAKNDLQMYQSYVSDMISFSTKYNVNNLFLNVLSPINGECYNASFIAKNFLDQLPLNINASVVTYVRPKDSGWNINNSLPGGYNTCQLTQPSSPCPKPDQPPPVISGCPNDMTQAMYYIGQINQMSQKNKITTVAFDGEDLGGYADPSWGMCQALQSAKIYAPQVVNVGYAKGPAITPSTTGGTEAFPEFYWIGELHAVNCTGDCNNPSMNCINTPYYKYKNQPQPFLDFFSPYIDPYAKYINQPGVWVMFSIENLQYGWLGTGPSCIATKYFGGNDYKKCVCGTFNGFSYWNWQSFEQFLELFAQKYNVKNIMIYEAQFIPDTWM